ncbi:FYVE, RhoGEF and PH domain-containing protein 5 [Halocaridina rubra]|uniref:FYVE, RhoGEF and PH domain-containing protein 5 n=1 Tax=Halocaridina rubra TaxID=373956 RepID=A0AAN8X794_HALRR
MKLLALRCRLTRSQHATSAGDDKNQPTTAASTSNFSYELIRPGRDLLKEGELLKLCRRVMQPRYYILLSDVLLYTSYISSGPGGALKLNYELPLEGMRVETPKAEDFKNEFSVISTSRSFTLQASTAEERDAWITTLREAIEENALRRSTFLQAKIPSYQQPTTSTLGKQAPVWIPDYRVTMCQQCTAEFTLTFRRHHCRACGKVVCDHCSANRAPLQYKRNQSMRVCDRCFEVLQQEFETKYRGSMMTEDTQEVKVRRVASLKAQFKRGDRENRTHVRKKVPERLLECGRHAHLKVHCKGGRDRQVYKQEDAGEAGVKTQARLERQDAGDTGAGECIEAPEVEGTGFIGGGSTLTKNWSRQVWKDTLFFSGDCSVPDRVGALSLELSQPFLYQSKRFFQFSGCASLRLWARYFFLLLNHLLLQLNEVLNR